jgi:acyl carrier protein
MKFEDARAQIIVAIDAATSILSEPRFAGRIKDPEFDIEFADLGLDSLAAMEICMALEEKAGIEIDLGDLAVHPSVNLLARHVVTTRAKG